MKLRVRLHPHAARQIAILFIVCNYKINKDIHKEEEKFLNIIYFLYLFKFENKFGKVLIKHLSLKKKTK